MKRIITILISLSLISLISCQDEDTNIDFNLLHDYNFQTLESSYPELIDGNYVLNDTVYYSFESQDSVIAVRTLYSRSEKGEDELLSIDSIFRKYEIINNKIRFSLFDWQFYKLINNDYLLDLQWNVLSLNNRELRIEMHTNKKKAGVANLKCIEKH